MSLHQCFLISFLLLTFSSSVLFNLLCWTLLTYVSQASSLRGEGLTNRNVLPSVVEYFPVIQGDLMRVKWGHAVNSKARLNESLHGKDMMIEADVLLGSISSNKSEARVPIMAHPPATTSDLTLAEFLDTIINSNSRKGVKLDFKHLNVVEQSLELLTSRAEEINFPLFLNADILSGPVNSSTVPLNATQFLTLVKRYFPSCVLSVGWTTRFGPDVSSWPIKFVNEGFYNFSDVKKMRDILVASGVQHPITFPVRAGLSSSVDSQTNLLWLLEQFTDSTITIWSGVYDTVDVASLIQLINKVGKERVYLDVPSGLHCEIQHFNDDSD